MVTFMMGKGPDNLDVLVVGLSYGNLKKLKKGEPIKLNEGRLKGSGLKSVYIFADRTEQDIARKVKAWCDRSGIEVDSDRHGWPGDPEA